MSDRTRWYDKPGPEHVSHISDAPRCHETFQGEQCVYVSGHVASSESDWHAAWLPGGERAAWTTET